MKYRLTALLLFLAACAPAFGSPPLGFKTDCTAARPCWSWYTLSNNERNVIVGAHKVIRVRPCEFAWLDYSGYINWDRTRPRRGDNIARAHGCDRRYYPPAAFLDSNPSNP